MRMVKVLSLLLITVSQIHSQWKEYDGPYGGSVRSLTFNGISGQLYIGTIINGIYTSTDNGSRWYTINNGLPNKALIYKIKIFKNNLYACTNGGLYKSTNNGNNWYTMGLQNKQLLSFAFTDSFILVGASDSLYRSANNGLTWNSYAHHGSNNPIHAIKFCDSIAYMGTEFGGVFKSSDLGLTWVAINGGLSSLNIRTIENKDSVLYCGTWGKGIYQSSDCGLNWIQIGRNFDKYITSMIFNDSKHYISTFNSGFYERHLGDSVWHAIDSNLDTKLCSDILYFNNCLYGATVSGIFKCHKDSLYWTDINRDIKGFKVTDLVIDTNESKLIISSNCGVFVSTNEGTEWMQKNKNLPPANFQINCLLNENGVYRAGSQGEGLYTANSVFSWTKITSPVTHVNKIIRKDSLFVLATDNQGIYAWDGTNWTSRNNGLTDLSITDLITDSVALYAGTKITGVFETTDRGNSWFELSDSLTDKRISSLVKTDSLMLAGTKSGIFSYSNDESRWFKRVNGMAGNPVVYKLHYFDGFLFAGTYAGFYYSTNNGLNWINKNNGIIGNVMTITKNNTDDVIIGTDEGYVYKRPLQDLVVSVSESRSLPNAAILNQNYPNPFNPSTVISYQLSVDGIVSLKIYNILGQEVRTLVNRKQNAGRHIIAWDGRDSRGNAVSTGVYLYRLQAGEFVITKKMILVK